MMKRSGATLFSASDLVNFMGCAHATFLDLCNLKVPVLFPPNNDATLLLQQKGIEHERAYLERLKAEGRTVFEIASDVGLDVRVTRTRDALRQGPDVIYQGAFLDGAWHGYSDFLVRVDRPVLARRLFVRGGRHQALALGQAQTPDPNVRLLGHSFPRAGHHP